MSPAPALIMLVQPPSSGQAPYVLLGLALLGLAAVSTTRRSNSQRSRASVFQEICAMMNGDTDLKTILRSSLGGIMDLLGMDAGSFRLANTSDDPLPVAVHRGFRKETMALLEQEASELLRRRDSAWPYVLNDPASAEPGEKLPGALLKEEFRYFALFPVRSGDRVAGVLGLAARAPDPLSKDDEQFIAAATDLLGVAVANAQLHGQAHKLSEDLIALQEVNKIISQSLDLEDIIRRIVIEGKRLVKTRECHLFLVDDRRQRLVGSASTQAGKSIRDMEINFSDESYAIQSLMERRVIAVDEMPHVEHLNRKVMNAMHWRAAIFAPLVAKEQAIGVLICSNDTADGTFTQEEISRAETLAHQAAIALENARLFQVVSRSQKEWETTFDAMQDCVSVHDTTGKIIRANVALARRLKTSPPQMIGKSCTEIYNPAGLNFSSCRHMDSLQTEGLMVEEVELPAMGGTFQVSVSPWYDKNNRVVGSIHVAKDVSHEKLLQQQLIQSEKLSAIGELISGIAHELNNPLTGVMGYSQLLQLRKDIDERAKENLLKINNLALRCQKIVQNLLSFARKQKPERTLTNVNDILERTVELRNYELSVNNIEIIRELDRDIPQTIADAHQLQQVFLNIITNAEHAMLQAHGRGRLSICSSTDRGKDRIVVEIRDDGPGIPESHLSKIFDPFFTTKEVGKGTGLGLSLSYGIIKEHGGNIYVRSRTGEGARFIVELPIISRIHDESRIFPELVPRTLHFDNLLRNKRILVVDDEKYILDFFVEIFRMFPIHVDTADNGRAAMERLKVQDYDLIITDFKMPHMSGRELFQWIKEERPGLAGRIIFVTGDTVSAETRTFFENNCSRYLAKPFKIEEVKEVIQQTLEEVAS